MIRDIELRWSPGLRRQRRWRDRFSQVRENGRDRIGTGDKRNETHFGTAPRAHERRDLVNARQQPHPGVGGPAPCEVTGLSGGARGGGVIPSPAALTKALPGTLFPAHAVTALRSGE